MSKILKNDKNKDLLKDLKLSFKAKDWNTAVILLQPAFDLLESATKSPIDIHILKRQYEELSPENKKVLDVMVSRAFLRKTSKLGLTFAQEQGQPILFAWSASGTGNDLNALHELLEVKPYKAEPPEFRINPEKKGIAQNSPEGITFSEMRELGRLKQKMMAPSYLLITDIKEATAPLQS